MYKVKLSTFAKVDKKRIIEYLSQYSIYAPVKFKQELKRYIELLETSLLIFAVYRPNEHYRHIVVFGSYSIFYTVDEKARNVFVYRILHGAQDIENILFTHYV